MDRAEGWFICRIGFLETIRAVALTGGTSATASVREEWPAFGVVEVDQELVEHGVDLALSHDLRSLDALHLAAALVLPRNELIVAAWDRRLHAAARAEGIAVFPARLD